MVSFKNHWWYQIRNLSYKLIVYIYNIYPIIKLIARVLLNLNNIFGWLSTRAFIQFVEKSLLPYIRILIVDAVNDWSPLKVWSASDINHNDAKKPFGGRMPYVFVRNNINKNKKSINPKKNKRLFQKRFLKYWYFSKCVLYLQSGVFVVKKYKRIDLCFMYITFVVIKKGIL